MTIPPPPPSDDELVELEAISGVDELGSAQTLEARAEVDLDDYEHASDAADAVIAALSMSRTVLRRGGQLVRVRGWAPGSSRTAIGCDGAERPVMALREGSPVVRSLSDGSVDYAIDRAVACYAMRRSAGRPRKDGQKPEAQRALVPCPKRVLRMIAGEGGDARDTGPSLPPLEGILQVPSLRPDGTVIEEPGYDPATGYYLASNVRLRALHPRPELDNARRALAFLRDLFAPTDGIWQEGPHRGTPVYGFPWKRGWDETIVPIAMILTAIARPALGCCPAFVVDASTPGSGKGKVVGVVSIVSTGDEPGRAGWPSSPEEQEKVLGAYAMLSPPIIAWDNVRGTIANAHLENALTTPVYNFRILGKTEMVLIPLRSLVTFTGNNVIMGGDMPRRTIACRLEPPTEHPEKIPSTAFRHPAIELVARANRGKLVAAALTILRAYVLAGMPDQGLRFGSFDRASGGLGWIELVGGALAWCGAGDITAFSAKESVQEPEEWSHVRTLLAAWNTQFDPTRQGVSLASLVATLYSSDVVEAIRKGQPVPLDSAGDRTDLRAAVQALSRCPDRAVPDTARLGIGLRPYVDRWFQAGSRERSFVHALNPMGKPYVPARWKVEER